MNKPRKEVQNLILMLSSAAFVAFVVAAGLVYYFGSFGTHLLRNVLISPDALKRISFTDYKPDSGEKLRFVFNNIEFICRESQGGGWGRYVVSKQNYKIFYKLIANERSISKLSHALIQQFDRVVPSTLTIFIQARNNEQTPQKDSIFQQVEFLDKEDVFRVKMRDSKDTWIYFRYPGIYNKVVEFFAPSLS